MKVKVKVLVAQPCLTVCDPTDCSPPGSSVYGVVQARILEWVAFSFSRGSFQPRDQTQVSCVAGGFFTSDICAVLWVVAQLCPILCDSMDDSPPGSSVHQDSPGKSTGVGCHALLQGIFPTQGSNLCLPRLLIGRCILYH